jgi:hypothetical protein
MSVSLNRCLLCLLATGVSFAILITAEPAWARPRAPHARRHQTLISTVSPTQITISEDSGPRTFTITPFTEIIVNEQTAKVGDLHPGMRVSVTLEDPVRLRQIKAWSAQ